MARSLRLLESRDGLADGVGTHQRVCGVRHQVQVGRHVGHVVGQHQVHRYMVAANFGLAVTDGDAVGVNQAVFGKDVAGVRIDDYLVDLFDLKQGVEDPAEQGLTAEISEIFAFDPHAVGLHGQQRYNLLRLRHHSFEQALLAKGCPLEGVG